MRTQLYEKPPEFPDGFFRARVPLPGNSSRSSNDVVEHPLPERPVEQERHAIPPCEPPLRDESSFYAPVEPPSAQHHLRKEVILGQAGTGPQGLLTGAARTGDNLPLTSTFRTRTFCPRKGAHFVKNGVQAERKANSLAFPRRSRHCREAKTFVRASFRGTFFGPSALNTDALSLTTHCHYSWRQRTEWPIARPL